MSKQNIKKDIVIFAVVFIVNYILLFILSATKVISDIGTPWTNHLLIISFFVFGFLIFEYIQKEIDFNFSEIYVALILIIMLYLGFYLAYLIYYSQTQGVFTYLLNSPYIHIAISFFAGYLTFFLRHFDFKK